MRVATWKPAGSLPFRGLAFSRDEMHPADYPHDFVLFVLERTDRNPRRGHLASSPAWSARLGGPSATPWSDPIFQSGSQSDC